MTLDSGMKFRGVSVLVMTVLVLAGLGASPPSVAAQGSDATVKSSMLLIMQGENDVVAGSETRNDFYALKILSYDLPHDAARVYSTVPLAAHDINVWYGTNTLNQSQYGRETSGTHAGQFYIDVPTSHVRTANYSVAATSLADFTATGSQLVNVDYSSGALRLIDESSVGTYISPSIAIPSSSVESILLTMNGGSTGNITSHVSTDDGTTWWSVQNATSTNITSSGSILKVMFELTGNATLGYDTYLASFQLTAVYVPATTLFTIHVSYLWTVEFVQGKTVLDLSEPVPFSTSGSYIIMLYTLPGYVPTGTGIEFTLDIDRTMNTYDDKDLYLSTSYPIGTASYTAEMAAPEASNNLMLYSMIALIAIALAGAYAYRGSRAKRSRSAPPGPVEETSNEDALVGNEARRRELVEKKKSLLSEIASVRAKLSSGEISQAAASSELARIKKEFKGVRTELNRLSRRSGAASDAADEHPKHESVIAALARIDDDFERGRLTESTYKTLRKEYVQRAASIMAAQSVASNEALSPLEQEKNKLMEAIVALDDEREKGEIDEKVYSDLRASYRKQLANLMKRAEELEGPG